MFNLKKSEHAKPYEKYLRDSNKKDGLSVVENPGSYDWLLQQKSRKDKDNSVPYNNQLIESRTGTNNAIVEKALNQNPKLYLDKRNEKLVGSPLKATDLMSEAYDQKKAKAYSDFQDGESRDTSFWDEYVGEQMLGPMTKIVDNKQNSQLENDPSRFKNLDETMPIAESQAENTKRNTKSDKVEKMVMASLQNADAMLFHIYGSAAKKDRGLNDKEKQIVNDINSGKMRVIAQLYDDEPDPVVPMEDNAYEQMTPEKPTDNIVIEPSAYDNGFDIVELTVYPQGSVLVGEPTKNKMNEEPFDTVEEAIAFSKQEYGIEPKVTGHSPNFDHKVPDMSPPNLGPGFAG